MSLAQPLRTISPTDVSQFIRLDQCQRYLKLRLREREEGLDFLYEYDVAPQSIPPLLSRSGARFEHEVGEAVASRFPVEILDARQRRRLGRKNNNRDVIDIVANLEPKQVVVVFQARLEADIAGWRMRGDVDILRFSRDADGALHVLIADMKSSAEARVEHRLQIAFYHEMLAAIFTQSGVRSFPFELAVLYRGPADRGVSLPPEQQQLLAAQEADATATFGTSGALLERIPDPQPFLWAVQDLVTGTESRAHRVLATDLEMIPYHLSFKCDGCLYNEYCMKSSAEHEDLSLLAGLTEQDKGALHRAGITTVRDLAHLKDLEGKRLVPAPGTEAFNQQLAATWPIGPRIDELVHRARRFRNWKGEDIGYLSFIPNRGYGSLPFTSEDQNPNLVRLYIDAQVDYLQDRLYLLGALVTGCENGNEIEARRQHVLALSDGPPDSAAKEEALILDWIDRVLRAIVEVAAPDADGEPVSPIHLVFFDAMTQRNLLDGLARHASAILGATAVYDFVTQIAGLDSSIASYLDQEVLAHRNYPMTCQSLQAIASYGKFDWGDYNEIFKARLFDYWRKLDEEAIEPGMRAWYMNRARFSSSIPLEYAYAAWDELPPVTTGRDEYAAYREVTREHLTGFASRRLEAIEHIAHSLPTNEKTTLSPFRLPDLAVFQQKAHTLAQALDEFMTIERHVELAEWRRVRLAAPEDRVLTGETLTVRYVEADQHPGIVERNRDNFSRHRLDTELLAKLKEENPKANRGSFTPEQKLRTKWSHDDMTYRLRIDTTESGCSLEEALRLTSLKKGGWAVLAPRIDSFRSDDGEIIEFTPTAKSLLYQPRVRIEEIVVERPNGTAVRAWVEVTSTGGGGSDGRGYTFGASAPRPFEADRLYTLDTDPNDRNGANIVKVVEGLVDGGRHRLHDLLTQPEPDPVAWPADAVRAQQRFLSGLDALREVGAFFSLESSKREYIGALGNESMLLVQGPPGTGKSASSAFAIMARFQAAMATGVDCRVVVSSKTHAAIDVLLRNILDARTFLKDVRHDHPEIFRTYFDRRLLDIDLFRMAPRSEPLAGIAPLYRKHANKPGGLAADRVRASQWCVVGSTPSGIYGMLKDFRPKDIFGEKFVDLVIMDEASQMNVPEAMAACLPLQDTGRVIVVGDHRQMPPIVKNNWEDEPRRTFKEFKAYASLFEAIRERQPKMIQFQESFRLHRDMAHFLGKEIYRHDGISFHSKRVDVLPNLPQDDPFVAAALDPVHPLTVVVHSEAGSMKRNEYEERIMFPILDALNGIHRLNAREGLGVVVPHTLQKAGLLENIRFLTEYDPATGEVVAEAVDTVERYQGGERDVIVISATESNREYVLAAGKFLLDPRRLNVALSRAKKKLILVASRSVFEVFSADEEMFQHAQLWKNLLRRTCTVPLWSGERDGHQVEVWGNSSQDAEAG